jgi:hypothetical protein
MTKISKPFIIAIFAVYATGLAAAETDCKGCDPQKLESSHREQIKTDRAKYDRENEKVTARPWDVDKNDKPPPDKNK